jgi:hypothetical protein
MTGDKGPNPLFSCPERHSVSSNASLGMRASRSVSVWPISLKNSMDWPVIRPFREVDLLAKPPFRADTRALADDRHPHHQFGINRRTAGAAVEGLQLRSNAVEFEMSIDSTQQMFGRDMIIETEGVEELRRSCLASHHCSILCKSVRRLNHATKAPPMPTFLIIRSNWTLSNNLELHRVCCHPLTPKPHLAQRGRDVDAAKA